MKYETVEIGNYVSLSQGFAINKKTDHHMSKVPTKLHLLRIGDMKDGSFSVYVNDTIPQRFIAKESDIIYTRTGQVGLVFRKQHGVVHNNCFTVTTIDEDKLSQEYLYYALHESSFYEEANRRATGAAQPDLPHGAFKSIKIHLPPVEIQKRITQILDSFESLVENNQKQIKLLEEAAQRLYKEWFVDLRFPGHENTQIIDGVPEGWSTGVLGDIAFDAGKRENKSNRKHYHYYLPIDCLPKKSLAYTETNDIELAESSLVAFSEDDILFGAMRPYFHKVVIARDCGLTRSTCFVINAKQKSYRAYLTMLMFSKDTVNYSTKISVGTTMPYARWNDMIMMPIIIPNEESAILFSEKIIPIFNRIKTIAQQNIQLKEARDILLPKLINGEIEV